MERILALAFKLKDGKFFKDSGTVVGKVLQDGTIQGTVYKFDEGKIRGGVAITTNSNLQEQEDGTLLNPATGDYFEPTKSKKGFFSPVTKTFVKPWGKRK